MTKEIEPDIETILALLNALGVHSRLLLEIRDADAKMMPVDVEIEAGMRYFGCDISIRAKRPINNT